MPAESVSKLTMRSRSVASPAYASLTQMLRERATACAGRQAFAFHPSDGAAALELQYEALDRRARAIAAFLQTRCAPGDRALLLYPSGLDFIAAFFGCAYAGVVAVPAYPPRPNESMRRLGAIVADAGAQLALTTTTLLQTSRQLSPANLGSAELRLLTTDDVPDGLANAWSDPNVDAEALAFLQYTSGSTGAPKGVMLTHAQLLANQEMIGSVFRLQPGTKVVSWLPLFHDMGLIGMALHTLYTKSSCALMPPAAFLQRPFRWLELISRQGASLSGAPNFAYDLCVRRVTDEERDQLDLSRWRLAFNGAEPIRAATLERFAERFGPCGFRIESFLPCYGMAEASLLVTGKPVRRAPVFLAVDSAELASGRVVKTTEAATGHRLVGSGRAARATQVIVVHPESREPLQDGNVGEIWIRARSVGAGYWNKPEATRETFQARLAGRNARTRYLRTGDLGFLHEGELFVTGRCKDLIVVRGRNHYPQDIEATVQAAHPALRPHGGVAFAVEQDATEGVVIVQEVERTALRELDATDVAHAIREAVAREHDLAPVAIMLVRPATVPKTSSGKLQRSECRRQFLHNALEVVGEWRGQVSETSKGRSGAATTAAAASARPSVAELQRWLVDRVAATLRLPAAAVDVRAPLHGLGLDSMAAVALSGELEAHLGVQVPPTLVYDHPTLEQIARHFAAQAPLGAADEKPLSGGDADNREIAIVGVGCRFPGGADSPEAFWAMLASGTDAVRPIPSDRWNVAELYDSNPETPGRMYVREGAFLESVDGFDPEFFGISPRDAAGMDPQHRLLLEVAWEALEHAAIAPASLARRETGVFMGVSFDDYAQLSARGEDAAQIDTYSALGAARSLAAGRLSYHLGLHGPSLLVDTLCSSSLVAVHLAVQSLRNGECSVALAGGANLMLSPGTTIASCKLRALAPDARCKTFDAAADGYGRGEGAGVVVLKRLADAQADGDRVLAVICGTAVNHNGRSNGLTAPSAAAQEALIRKALRDAQVEPAAVGFVETHGTGTILGDPIEVQALAGVYGAGRNVGQPLLLGAVKTNVGHLEAAAGVAGLIKTVLALQEEVLPANLHFNRPNPYVPWATLPVRVVDRATPWAGHGRVAGVSSFGLGGTNAHVILAAPPVAVDTPERSAPIIDRRQHVFTLSAQTSSAAEALARAWANQLATRSELSLGDVCFSANTGRNHLARRLALQVGSTSELVSRLRGVTASDFVATPMQAPEVVFEFPTALEATPEELRELHATEPAFRQALEKNATQFSVAVGSTLGEAWYGAGDALATFGVQTALAQLWQGWGVKPAQIVGWGSGELAAACCAGMMSFADAAWLLVARRRLDDCEQAITTAGDAALKLAAMALRTATKTGVEAIAIAEPKLPLRLGSSVEHARARDVDFWLRERREEMNDTAKRETSVSPNGAERLRLIATAAAVGNALAKLQVAGVEIDWQGVERGFQRRRISGLPTYPFQRRRCWIATKGARTSGATVQAAPTYELAWRGRSRGPALDAPRGGEWIVCCDDLRRGASLVQELTARGQRARVVNVTDWNADAGRGIAGIVFMGVTVAEVARQTRAILPRLADGARLWIVTQRAIGTGQDDEPLALEASPLAGFARALVLEHPERWGALLDMDDLARAGGIRCVVDELLLHDGEPILAWRGDQRLAPRLVAVALPEANAAAFSPEVTHLITGGTGGLGLRLARWLAARGARHLVLMSRRGTTEECERARVELAAAGVNVRIIAADVSSRESLASALDEMAGTMPALGGVFHAAGVSGFKPLAELGDEEFAAVLAPKVDGARWLDELTRGKPIEHFVLFSSIASVWGSHGQTHYAAANSFLDALAHERRRAGLAALSVNWGPWDEVGMADGAAREQLRRVGLRPLNPDAAFETLGRALASQRTQVVVAEVDWSVLRPLLTLRRQQSLLDDVAGDNSSRRNSPETRDAVVAARLRALDPTQRTEALGRYLQDEVAHVLGRDPTLGIDPQQGFFSLGMDSLMAVELRAKLEQDLGLALPATLAFDRSTLAALQTELQMLLFPATADREQPATAAPANRPVGAAEPIAIVGLGCRFPGGVTNAHEFWALLREGRDAVRPLSRTHWDVDALFHPDPAHAGTMYVREFGLIDEVDRFDAAFFNLYPREASSMDPQQRLLLETAWEALEMAGLGNEQLRGSSTGVFIGASTSDYAQLLLAAGDASRIDAYFGTGNALNAIAGRLAFTFGLRGPTLVTDTACSSSLVALHQACQSLRAGECVQAIAGGVNLILTPEPTIALSRARMLAPDGRCKTFSAAADGYGRGEGCGVVVLKRLADAEAAGDTVLAVIRGSAVNQDGASSGFTVPSGAAQQELVRRALAQAGRTPDELDYVEAHGTGTPLGDPIEINALAGVVGSKRARPLVVGAVKTNLGHLEAAAGIAGVIKTVLALRHGTIPPHLHFRQPSPHIAWEQIPVRVPVACEPWPSVKDRPLVAGVSAFGFTGTNAHVILESATDSLRASNSGEPEWHLVPLSARTAPALRMLRARVAAWLRTAPEVALADLARTFGAGRMHHSFREVYCVRSVDEFGAELERRDEVVQPPVAAPPPLALICNESDAMAEGRRWLAWGLKPAAIVGDGRGLVAAGALAGVFSDAEAPRLAQDVAAIESIELQAPRVALMTLQGRVPDALASSRAWWREALASKATRGDPSEVAGHRPLVLGRAERETMLRAAAELYLDGYTLDWRAMQDDAGRHRPDAPTYPFQRERHWFDAAPTKKKAAPARQGVAALLGERVPLPGSREVRFAAEYSAASPAILDHHRLFGRVIAPAAQHISLGLAAARKIWAVASCELETLTFPQAIVLDEGVACRVQLVLTPKEETRFEAQLLGAPEKEDESWTLHATVGLQRGVRADWETAWRAVQAGSEVVDGAQFYSELASAGYTLGASFRWLQKIWRGEGCAIGELEPPAGALEVDAYDLHPGLIDSCFQLLGWCAGVNAAELAGGAAIYIPARIDAVRFHVRPSGRRLRCEARVTSPDHARTHRLRGDLRLWDESGACVLEVDGFEARRMPRSALAPASIGAVGATDERFYALDWEELPGVAEESEGTERRQESWSVLPGGALAAALASQLNNGVSGAAARTQSEAREECVVYVMEGGGRAGVDAAAHFLATVQALIARATPPRLVVVTVGGQPVPGDSGPVSGAGAAVGALARIAAMEHPELRVRLIDIEAQGTESEAVALERELVGGSDENVVALRGGKRFGARLVGRPLAMPHAEPMRLKVGHYGELDSLQLVPATRRAPARGEVEIEVRAAGLNFRDVLNALGLLRAHLETLGVSAASELPLGGECAGVVTAVGEGVTTVRVGDGVLAALATGCLGSHVVVDARFVVPQPTRFAPAEAAGLPVAYLTAHYALRHLAKLQPGERVLIHAAAGGVGLAAVHVARLIGAEVCATASPGKWAVLRSLGVRQIGNSRNTNYAGEFQPVDVVLNSLNGEHIPASLGLVRPGGRFVEIGKLGIWSAEQMAAKRGDVAYHCFDLVEMAQRVPAVLQTLLQELAADWNAGRLPPLPTRCFPLSRAADAFRVMAQSKHVGKLVLVRGDGAPPQVRRDGAYLVTGGLGGIGFAVAGWLVRAGAGAVILTGRRAPSAAQEAMLSAWRASGTTVVWRGADLAAPGAVRELVETCAQEFGPLRGVFHAAGALDDGALQQQSRARLEAVWAPKAAAGWALHEATLDQPIEMFVLFSSLAAVLGSPGQSTYAAANAALDALAHERRRLALPAISINWGPWAEGGMAARLGQRERARLEAMGLRAFSEGDGLAALEAAIGSAEVQIAAAQLNREVLTSQFAGRVPPLLRRLAGKETAAKATPRAMDELRAVPAESRSALLARLLERRLVSALGLGSDERLEHERSLVELGLDSLLAIELKSWIAGEFGAEIPMQDMAGATLAGLARAVLHAIGLESADGGSAEKSSIEAQLRADAQLPDDIRPGNVRRPAVAGFKSALLTGATGFLGAFLLHELLTTTDCRVHCLVRARTPAEGFKRIADNLAHYGLGAERIEERLTIVPGDLAEAQLGLTDDAFAALARDVDVVFHNGAWLNFFYPYATLKPANVLGTTDVLRLAARGEPKPVHYVSTSGVFYSRAYHGRMLPETDAAEHCEGHALGYSQSKWVAERLVAAAGERGLPVTIHRAPFITGHSGTGAWNADDFICRLVRGIVALGVMPELAATMDVVPVDYVARAIVGVASGTPEAGARRYHLCAAEPVPWGALAGWLEEIGYPVRREPYGQWLTRLPALRGTEHPLAPFVTLFLEKAGAGRATVPEVFLQSAHAHLDGRATAAALARSGLDAPRLDAALWRRYFAALRAAGLVPPPVR